MKKPLLIPLASAVLLCASSASATVTIGSSAVTAFSGDSVASGTTIDEANAQLGSKENRDHTQTFQLDSDLELGTVYFGIRSASDDASFTLRVWDLDTPSIVDKAAELGLSGATELISESFTPASGDAFNTTASGDVHLMTWTLDSSVSLSSGNSYAVQIDDDGSGNVPVRWAFDNEGLDTDSYANGAVFRDNGSGLTPDIFGNGTVEGDAAMALQAVPEPALSAFVLGGLSALVLLIHRRRRAS